MINEIDEWAKSCVIIPDRMALCNLRVDVNDGVIIAEDLAGDCELLVICLARRPN